MRLSPSRALSRVLSRVLSGVALFAISGVLLSGCAKTDRQEASGKGVLVAINAIVDAPDVAFRIEERSLGAVAFGNATPVNRYDDLTYIFNYDAPQAGTSEFTRLASRQLKVERDIFYLFALGGSLASPQIFLWEDAVRQWADTDTVFELAFANLSNDLGAVDVYFAAPGIAPALGNAIATLAYGERLATAEFAAGDYELIITPQGDTQTLLYTSGTRTFNAASSDTIVLFDADPSRNGNATVRLVGRAGTSVDIGDPRFAPTMTVLHAAIEIGNVDVAENGNFTNLIVSNLAFAEQGVNPQLTPGLNSYEFTDTGNQGASLAEEELNVTSGSNYRLTLVGPASSPDVLAAPNLRRPFATSGRISAQHAAAAISIVDIYLLETGASLDDNIPFFGFVPFKASAPLSSVKAGSYEVTVTPGGEKTAIAGPVALDISNGQVVELYILETADPNVAEIRIERFP